MSTRWKVGNVNYVKGRVLIRDSAEIEEMVEEESSLSSPETAWYDEIWIRESTFSVTSLISVESFSLTNLRVSAKVLSYTKPQKPLLVGGDNLP